MDWREILRRLTISGYRPDAAGLLQISPVNSAHRITRPLMSMAVKYDPQRPGISRGNPEEWRDPASAGSCDE
jgi:hypothetical protein